VIRTNQQLKALLGVIHVFVMMSPCKSGGYRIKRLIFFSQGLQLAIVVALFRGPAKLRETAKHLNQVNVSKKKGKMH